MSISNYKDALLRQLGLEEQARPVSLEDEDEKSSFFSVKDFYEDEGGNLVKKLRVCLGWKTPNANYDLDASCFLLNGKLQCRTIHDAVCYSSPLKRPKFNPETNRYELQKKKARLKYYDENEVLQEGVQEIEMPIYEYFSIGGNVLHSGDVLSGKGNDDEVIYVDLKFPRTTDSRNRVQALLFAVTIFGAKKRGQTFGGIKQAYVKIYNDENNLELYNSHIEKNGIEAIKDNTAFLVGMVCRDEANKWYYIPLERGMDVTLDQLKYKLGIRQFPTNH